VAVCGVWAGKERESEGKRSRRAPWFWCAREKGAAGSVLAGPRRRRGGSREELLGGVAKGGEVQREEEGVEELLYDAWKLAGGRWRGRAAQSGVAPSVGGEREQRSWRKGKRTQTKFPKTLGTNL